MMNYESMKKDELIKIIEDQKHLASAVEAKDKEISDLKYRLGSIKDEQIAKSDKKLEDLRIELANKYESDYFQLKQRSDDDLKKTKDSLAQSQNNYIELDKLRVEQLNTVLFAYGDLLKTLQGIVDTHMKLNTFIVKSFNGGEE